MNGGAGAIANPDDYDIMIIVLVYYTS